MNSVKIKRREINEYPKKDIQCIFSKYEYIHARYIHMRKIVYSTISIDKYQSLYMSRYTDTVTKVSTSFHNLLNIYTTLRMTRSL